jgi:dTDP-4-amino-4,6-dideoxygalactose transaminase
MDWRVPLADLDYGIEEETAVLDVLRRRWLTMGAVTQQFEEEFKQFTKVKYAIALSNATVALHLACLALGIGQGDEVIAPALTFVASTNAILYTGAQVHFADINSLDDLNIDPVEIEKNITDRTRAIMVVHYGGYPCKMEEIKGIARRHGLFIIEDAAHAPGASLQDVSLGAWGDVGCFSFFSNKNLSTGEGGMLVTNREDIAEKARLLRSHGMTTLTWDRHQGHAHTYDVVDLGYNYRIDEIRSALGLVQLHKLSENNARRKDLTQRYWDAFEQTDLGLPFRRSPGAPSYHIFPVLLPEQVEREKFIQALKSAGIQTSIHYPPIHHFSYYRRRMEENSLPVTEVAAAREVTLPLYPTMGEAAQRLVIDQVCRALDELQ